MFKRLSEKKREKLPSNLSYADSLSVLRHNFRARAYFDSMKYSNGNVVCLAYIAMDSSYFHRTYDRENARKLHRRVKKQLSAFCSMGEFASCVGDAAFTVGLSCENGFIAQQRINKLIDHLNQSESEIFDDSVAPFHAGLCFASDEANGFDALLHNAVLAYHHACDRRMSLYICSKDLFRSESYMHFLRDKLSNAIEEQQFELFLQLMYNTKDKKFTCAEVLSRWNHPLEGMLMPAYYLNDMRATGIIEKFDLYMLDKTCSQLEKWSSGPLEELCLSCNITRITISAPSFTRDLRKVLKKYRFDHSRLTVEITEDTLIDREIALKNIDFLKESGIRISIDDFCAGHSTLEDISVYPIDQVKLDRNMILSASTKRGNAFLKELIAMAHRLEVEVVCEGVESDEQRSTVLSDGCDYIQGYYYSRVLSLEDAKAHYLKQNEAAYAK